MDLIYPGAVWRPLGPQTEPTIGTPRVLIFHTMVGNLASTDSMFRSGGYQGTESTFGVGGPWERGNLDGVVYQWQYLDHQADAQWDGNAYASSIETADGGNPQNPWSPRQLEALIRLGVWWCQQTKNPARLVSFPGDKGFGYHRQFAVWNKNAHSCPGDVRLDQLLHDVLPEVQRRLIPKPPPPPAEAFILKRYLMLQSPHMTGNDVVECQKEVRCAQDGDFGPITSNHVIAYQKAHHLTPDGIVGPVTARSFGWIWRG